MRSSVTKPRQVRTGRYGYEVVAADILSRILRGEWALGERIDTIDVLEKRYPYSRMSIFKAVQHLASQGYVSMRRSSGAYVTSTTILRRIGFIFSEDLYNNARCPYSYVIFKEAEKLLPERGGIFKVYVEKPAPDLETWIPLPELEEDLRRRLLHGIITVGCNAPVSLMRTTLWKNLAVPHVSMTGHPNLPHCVTGDMGVYFQQSLSFCAKRKLADIAFISPGLTGKARTELMKQASALKLKLDPDRILDEDFIEFNPELAGYDLLLKLWQQTPHPQALILTDDVVAKGVCLAAVRLQIQVPDQLTIISLTNKDSGIFYPVPVVAFEYDLREQVETALNLLYRLIDNPDTPPETCQCPPVLVKTG